MYFEVLTDLGFSSRVSDRLQKLAQIFLEKGSARGVTALKTKQAILDEFILDSLCGVSGLPKEGRVIDIGTGGGVPGLVLAIVRPDLDFVLTDSASKKTQWVIELVDTLELSNVSVETRRLEVLGREELFRGVFDLVTAKALAPLNVLCELALPLLRVGGRLLAYKGPALAEEIQQAQGALTELGGRIHRCHGFRVGAKETTICEVLKSAPTPDKYPRRDGVPQKKPLLANKSSFSPRKN